MGFKNIHPTVIVIYFAAVVLCGALFDDWRYLAVSFVFAFIYSVKLNRKKGVVFDCALLVFVALFVAYYAFFNHFGATVLCENFIGNTITVESLLKGMFIGCRIVTVIMWLWSAFVVITTDKIVYVFGTISPKLSIFLSIIFRMIPRVKEYAKRINTAQKGIGRGINQGNVFKRLCNLTRLISALITVVTDSFLEVSQSMKCRGGTLKQRTAFSIYRFDLRDRVFVSFVFVGILSAVFSIVLSLPFSVFDPFFKASEFSLGFCVFVCLYAVLCAMPFVLDIYTQRHFEKMRNNVFSVKKHTVCG